MIVVCPWGLAPPVSRFSSALKFILAKSFKVYNVVKVIDDFLFVEGSERACKYALDSFLKLCNMVGVPIAHEKTVGPCRELVFLGINFDLVTNTLSIPRDKVERYV